MQQPINDRTRREVDRETVVRTLSDEGYEQAERLVAELTEAGRAVTDPNEAATGYTHAKQGPNDHYWRLVTAGGRWYFYFTDYSPRVEEAR